MLVHLNVHSQFSAMRGMASLQELLTAARDQGMAYLALTEVNGLWGFIRFVQHAHAAGVKPIAGANIIMGESDLVLLVENSAGYSNLCRIISAVHDDESIGVEELIEPHSSGLFVLAHRYEDLEKLATFVLKSHLYVELRPGVAEASAKRMSRNLGLETVATGDIYFMRPEDQPAHKVLRAIEKNATLSQLTVADFKPETNYFCDEKELIRRFPNSLEAINNSSFLAERCKTDWNFVNTIFPGLDLKNQHRSNTRLRKLVEKGARERYGRINGEVRQRINYELELITQKGFAPYFLVVRDIVQQTKSTIGRGSAAASVVSYCLCITQVDPILFNLQFERFIHPERESMPDIDVDFPWDERDNIIDYVFKKYGNQRTAMVASQVFLRPRSAIREVAKVYGLSNEEINAITKRIGYQWRTRSDLVNWIKTDPRFANAHLDDTLLEVIARSQEIVGTFRNPSVHPGGIVIVPDEIRKHVPVLTAPKGVQITEWEKDQVEDSGLLKIDLLGNRSLAVVRDTIKQINLYYPKKARSDYIDYHRIQPIGDPKTEALMQA
ncbi:MAG: DNA polymerase III subunit alpha, partial [Candidatus Marinimicrobia bacterium]|nr:DNA polymerase III subunit alpha [Candidatus Neomarinimicrobiota bacterium]